MVLGPTTRRLVQGVFVTRLRGEGVIKGLREPVPIVEAERVVGVRSRLDVALRENLTPLIGRDAELSLFEDRLARVADEGGQVIFVGG